MTSAQILTYHSKSKYRKSNEQLFGALYSAIVLTIGISFAIYGAATYGYSSKLMAARIFFVIMYTSSFTIVIMLWIYFIICRNKSYEKIRSKEKSVSEAILSMKGEEVNLYLRFGVGLFGTSSSLFAAISAYVLYLDSNSNSSSILHGVSQTLFIIFQTIFVLYYHRLIVLSNKLIIKCALIHLIITNILMWADASIGKFSSAFVSSVLCKSSSNNVWCILCIYLLPTLSEYAVIVAAVIHEIISRIGKKSLIELEHEKQKETKSRRFHGIVSCIIVASIIVFICAFTSISSVVLNDLNIGNDWVYYFHCSQMILLNILGIVFLFLTFSKIKDMKFSIGFTTSSLDLNILFGSYVIAIVFSWIVLINCGCYISLNLAPDFTSSLQIRLASAVFEIVQSSLQTYFIFDWFKRCGYDLKQEEQKPGKGFLAILIGINFGMWFLWTLQLKNGDLIFYKVDVNYNFITTFDSSSFKDLLLFVIQSTLPLGMLFRYHSSACLSEIYFKIYQIEPEIFMHHLKSEKLFKIKEIMLQDENMIRNRRRSRSVDIIQEKLRRRDTLKNIDEARCLFMAELISRQRKPKVSPMINKENSNTNSFGETNVAVAKF